MLMQVAVIAVLAVAVLILSWLVWSRRAGTPAPVEEESPPPADSSADLDVVDRAPVPVVESESLETFRVRDPNFPQRELLVEFVPADMAQLAAQAGGAEVGDGDY